MAEFSTTTGIRFGDYMSLTYDGILVGTALTLFADLRAGGWGRAAVADLVSTSGREVRTRWRVGSRTRSVIPRSPLPTRSTMG